MNPEQQTIPENSRGIDAEVLFAELGRLHVQATILMRENAELRQAAQQAPAESE